jgi:aspartyl-tRNA(Asn)/glutamyl-tRNA(Gln) amidotransferase subunit A
LPDAPVSSTGLVGGVSGIGWLLVVALAARHGVTMRTIEDHARALADEHTTSRALVETCLERIADPGGEGARTFVAVHGPAARAMADAMDTLRGAGRAPGRLAGIPVAIKDLCDIEGETTRAGSRALDGAPAATETAPAVRRLMAAGMIPIGRTNMSEFAFSGLGINPHFGTPRAPWDRAAGRIPGGSSSGTAVAVADGMAVGGLGTDTGGSCRIPAAFCGIVGYKPTARRVPLGGILPLAPSLDSVGPLAPSVACCAAMDAIFAGAPPAPPAPPLAAPPVAGLRFAVPDGMLLEGMDADVAAAFARALSVLSAAGARIRHVSFAAFAAIAEAGRTGGFAAVEAYAWHRALLERRGATYDPHIRRRIERGARQSAADYLDLLAARARIIAAFDAATQDFDAVLLPTVPIVPPRIAALDDEADYNRLNLLILRNTAPGNFLDRCAISLPCHGAGEPPVGLMLMGETMGDERLFGVAAAVETALAEAAG